MDRGRSGVVGAGLIRSCPDHEFTEDAMSETVPVVKDEHDQSPIPSAWRATLSAIAQALKEGDFLAMQRLPGVRPIAPEDAAIMMDNIESYGARLISLPDTTWQTSACQWMRGYWDVLVDLYTEEEGASDLVLSVRVREEGAGYAFDVQLVYVP